MSVHRAAVGSCDREGEGLCAHIYDKSHLRRCGGPARLSLRSPLLFREPLVQELSHHVGDDEVFHDALRLDSAMEAERHVHDEACRLIIVATSRNSGTNTCAPRVSSEVRWQCVPCALSPDRSRAISA